MTPKTELIKLIKPVQPDRRLALVGVRVLRAAVESTLYFPIGDSLPVHVGKTVGKASLRFKRTFVANWSLDVLGFSFNTIDGTPMREQRFHKPRRLDPGDTIDLTWSVDLQFTDASPKWH